MHGQNERKLTGFPVNPNSNLSPDEYRDSIGRADEKRESVQLDGETHWRITKSYLKNMTPLL